MAVMSIKRVLSAEYSQLMASTYQVILHPAPTAIMNTDRNLEQGSTGDMSPGAGSVRTRAKFSAKRLADFRELLPDFDVLGSVIEPTANLAMELQVGHIIWDFAWPRQARL